MPRQKNVQPSKDIHLCLDLATYVKMEFYLNSEAHGRKVPYAAKQKFITALIAQFFEGKGGVKEALGRTELQRIYDLVAAIDDLASHPQVAPEAFKAIASFSREARQLLLKKASVNMPAYKEAISEVT